MPTSRRYAVIKAVADQLKTITTGNGYSYNLSNAVFIGRRTFGDTDPMPAITLLEIPDIQLPESKPETGDAQKANWEFFVQGFIRASDPNNPTLDAYNLMADATKALAGIMDPKNDPRHGSTPNAALYLLGGKIMRFDIGGFHVRQSDEVPSQSNFYLRIRTQVVEKLTDPYD